MRHPDAVMMTAHALPFRRWECTACGACFDSLNAFKMHRAELSRINDLVTEAKCLNSRQMRNIGLRKDETGFWRGVHLKRSEHL